MGNTNKSIAFIELPSFSVKLNTLLDKSFMKFRAVLLKNLIKKNFQKNLLIDFLEWGPFFSNKTLRGITYLIKLISVKPEKIQTE